MTEHIPSSNEEEPNEQRLSLLRTRELILKELPPHIYKKIINYSRHVLKWALENYDNQKRLPDELYEEFMFDSNQGVEYPEFVKDFIKAALLYELLLYLELIENDGLQQDEIKGVKVSPIDSGFSVNGYLSGNGQPTNEDSLN